MAADIFRHADKALDALKRDISREFQALSWQLGFDELNVLETRSQVRAMYRALDAIIRRQYMMIAENAYLDALREQNKPRDDFDAYTFVNAMLAEFDTVSDFIYDREWTRKRDRLFESIIATQIGNQEMRKNLKRGLDVLYNQVRQYADNITVKARMEAFRRMGVRYVMWVTEHDDRVCRDCEDLDGKIFPIDEAPVMPAHWHCRCVYIPANRRD